MAHAAFNISTFTIPSIDASSAATGSVTMRRHPLIQDMNSGLIVGMRVSVAGTSSVVEIRLNDAAMASDRAQYAYKLSDIDGAKSDDNIFTGYNLTNDLLYWRATNGDMSNATGDMSVWMLHDSDFDLHSVGAIT